MHRRHKYVTHLRSNYSNLVGLVIARGMLTVTLRQRGMGGGSVQCESFERATDEWRHSDQSWVWVLGGEH